jgi:hypothetical protein
VETPITKKNGVSNMGLGCDHRMGREEGDKCLFPFIEPNTI